MTKGGRDMPTRQRFDAMAVHAQIQVALLASSGAIDLLDTMRDDVLCADSGEVVRTLFVRLTDLCNVVHDILDGFDPMRAGCNLQEACKLAIGHRAGQRAFGLVGELALLETCSTLTQRQQGAPQGGRA